MSRLARETAARRGGASVIHDVRRENHSGLHRPRHLLFFVLSYLNERRALEEVCSFLHRQVLVLPEGARSLEAPYGLDEAYKRCQTSRAIPTG